MTREKAQEAALGEEKITHAYFSKDEYVTVVDNVFLDEKNYHLDWYEFWGIRNSEGWQNDWKIYKP
jgi:hypothetical protein